MEEYPPASKKNRLTALAFLKVGIFEIGFVAVILLLLFGTLNYFNIFSVSDAFPNQFSWLPRQQTQTKTASQGETLQPQKATPTFIPLPPVPRKIVADAKSIVEGVLIVSLIPSDLSFKIQGVKTSNNSTIYSYSASWVGKNKERFNPIVKYDQNQAVSTRQITVYVPQSINNLDAFSSALLVTRYIKIDPPTVFKCKNYLPNSKITFCESFWEEKDGVKRGIDVNSPLFGLNESQIFYCEFHKDDINYLWKSCNSEFSQTGT